MSERLTQGGDRAPPSADITALLQRWCAGDASARDELMPIVYERLHDLAHERRRYAPSEHSLNTTALVHETYIRLAGARQLDLPNRARFLSLAAQVMRNLLVDHVRARRAQRRGGGRAVEEFDETSWMPDEALDTMSALHEALGRLQRLNPRQSQLLEQRYFGGLTLEEAASALGISLATAKRELRSARAWLALELKGEPLP